MTDLAGLDPEHSEPAADKAGNLGEQAFQRIRADILFYQLPPGVRVSEASLTQRYGLRHAAVRSALLRLVQEGLIDKSDERSPRVAPLTLKDVRDIYGLRLLLEPRAAELAAAVGLSASEAGRLRQISQCRYEAGGHDERKAFLNANREFSLLIASKSGNARLQATITQLQDLTLRILYVGLGRLNVSDWFRDKHLQIVDAIESHDGARAAELWRIDLTYGERLVADALTSLPALSEVNLASGLLARPR